MNEFKTFCVWCQNVLPVVYDDSLSYYEVLCKVVNYINGLINTDREIIADVENLENEVKRIEEIIENLDYDLAEKIITEAIATMVFFGLTDTGYFVAYIPDSWSDITFETTGYDVIVPTMPEYGHLCLAY